VLQNLKSAGSYPKALYGLNALMFSMFYQQNFLDGGRPSILELLLLYQTSEVTDPRDKFFALIGLSDAAMELETNPDLSINYKEEFLSVAARYTKYLMHSEGQEAISILSLAGIQTTKDSSLPS
jgi:hypothetical protein